LGSSPASSSTVPFYDSLGTGQRPAVRAGLADGAPAAAAPLSLAH